jgi:hypothetical protein
MTPEWFDRLCNSIGRNERSADRLMIAFVLLVLATAAVGWWREHLASGVTQVLGSLSLLVAAFLGTLLAATHWPWSS